MREGKGRSHVSGRRSIPRNPSQTPAVSHRADRGVPRRAALSHVARGPEREWGLLEWEERRGAGRSSHGAYHTATDHSMPSAHLPESEAPPPWPVWRGPARAAASLLVTGVPITSCIQRRKWRGDTTRPPPIFFFFAVASWNSSSWLVANGCGLHEGPVWIGGHAPCSKLALCDSLGWFLPIILCCFWSPEDLVSSLRSCSVALM